MIRIFRHLRTKEWCFVILSVLFIVAQVWLDLRLPEYMTEITALVQTEGSEMAEIYSAGGKMLLCALGSLITSVVVGFFAAQVAANLSRRLRREIFEKVESFSMEEISGFSTDSLITRSTNDITQIEMIVAMGLQLIVKAPIMAVMAILKIQDKGTWQWSALTACAVVLLVTTILIIMFYSVPKFKRIQGLTDNLNRVSRENLTGLRVVRAYNAETYQEEKFDRANEELTGTHLKAQRAMQVMSPMMSLVMNGITLGIYWIGAYLIDAAGISDKLPIFSNMVVFSSYAMQVIMAFTMLTMIFIMLPRAAVSAKRIEEVLDTKPTILDGTASSGEVGLCGEVEFRHVSFKYPDAEDYVLHDISFTAHKGETVAFIGATGSGKSTIVNLVARFYDATEGEVLVDGINVKDYRLRDLYNKLGYVPQRAVLFSGTVKSNVAFGDNGKPPADETEIAAAVRTAQSADFVERLEGQYDGAVAQGGANFSGGQKQRLSIARAICRKPEIYIFDDSFSALDYKTDRVLRSALKKETAGVTSLIVAQRIGTIKDADRIIVIDEGRAVGIGTHDELMASCDVYREIALSQLSKEELGA
ncbi:MAG: multidrug ABC transporter ATP-binding protein [Clostridiales bacterium]|nr:MAG: multidrug ABC transporter ATP-binding protein [Clostridiales bacterium]